LRGLAETFIEQENTMSDPIVIVSAARTPMGSFQGDFSSLAAHDLGGAAIRAAVDRAGLNSQFTPELVTEVLFGNCLMAGQGQAPARQAGFKGGLPKSAGAVTLSKMCGSGMRAACSRTTCWSPVHTMCWWPGAWKA
jgi:acetyl-CoA C-acetyltransferase